MCGGIPFFKVLTKKTKTTVHMCDGRKGFRARHLQSAVLLTEHEQLKFHMCDGCKGFRALHLQSAVLFA